MRRLLILSLILTGSVAMAADTKTGFVDKTHKNADGTTSPYVVFVPHNHDATKKSPVILFLHGAGETKSTAKGAKMPVEVGLGPVIKKNEKTFEYITVIPQSEKRGWGATGDDGKRAMAMLDTVLKEYNGDANRVYLTGLSMGGYGTWSHAAEYPGRWAAIVPICGGGDPTKAEAIKSIPCWCFHGDKDTAVKVEKSREMIEAMKKAGGSPKYTEYPGVAHNSWDAAYATKELWSWLAEQKKTPEAPKK